MKGLGLCVFETNVFKIETPVKNIPQILGPKYQICKK